MRWLWALWPSNQVMLKSNAICTITFLFNHSLYMQVAKPVELELKIRGGIPHQTSHPDPKLNPIIPGLGW